MIDLMKHAKTKNQQDTVLAVQSEGSVRGAARKLGKAYSTVKATMDRVKDYALIAELEKSING